MSEVLCIGFGLGQSLSSCPCMHIMLVESMHNDKIRCLWLRSDTSNTRAVCEQHRLEGAAYLEGRFSRKLGMSCTNLRLAQIHRQATLYASGRYKSSARPKVVSKFAAVDIKTVFAPSSITSTNVRASRDGSPDQAYPHTTAVVVCVS